jgi:hypothetical protein
VIRAQKVARMLPVLEAVLGREAGRDEALIGGVATCRLADVSN